MTIRYEIVCLLILRCQNKNFIWVSFRLLKKQIFFINLQLLQLRHFFTFKSNILKQQLAPKCRLALSALLLFLCWLLCGLPTLASLNRHQCAEIWQRLATDHHHYHYNHQQTLLQSVQQWRLILRKCGHCVRSKLKEKQRPTTNKQVIYFEGKRAVRQWQRSITSSSSTQLASSAVETQQDSTVQFTWHRHHGQSSLIEQELHFTDCALPLLCTAAHKSQTRAASLS